MNFGQKLRSGKFVLTAEISPPKGPDMSGVLEDAGLLRDLVDAVNVTDNQRAMMRMAPVALCRQLLEMGIEPVMHVTCRDRNRLALQSDLLAGNAMGISNILAMSGDYPTMGDQPGAKPVYDLDSVQLLQLIGKMNKGIDFQDGPIDGPTSFIAGAVANPGSRPLDVQLIKLNKKVEAGANFIQTQAVFDVGAFMEFVDAIKYIKIPVIAGIIPLRSARSARFMNENIPGVRISEEIIKRMELTSDPTAEGLRIAAETIQQIRPVCQGVHIMPIGGHKNTMPLLELIEQD